MKRRSASPRLTGFLMLLVGFLCVPAPASELAVLRNGFKIRHEHRAAMGDKVRLYLSADDSSFTDIAAAEIAGYEQDLSPPPAPVAAQSSALTAGIHSTADLNEIVNSTSATYHLDPDLVNSVIHAESGFNTRARSAKGAQGLMQLMPSTAGALGVNHPFDPQENVGGGSQYLRQLLERYNFDLIKALAAYNAGPHRVEQYKGVPPYRETRAYVARIVHEYNQKKTAQEKAQARQQSAAQATGASSNGNPSAPSARKPSTRRASTGHATARTVAGGDTGGPSQR